MNIASLLPRAAASLLLAALSTAVLAAPAVTPATVRDYAMKPQKLAPNVYAVITPARDFPTADNKGWNSNAGFVVTSTGVLVFDTGSSEVIGEALRKVIRKVSPKPVRWIVNSHGHGDHWLGNQAVADRDTVIYASAKVRDRIQREGKDWVRRMHTMTGGLTGESTVRAPTQVVQPPHKDVLGGVKVELIASGDSHSPGDLLLWLPEQKILFAGDVVYSDRAPATFDGQFPQWVEFLRVLEALKPKSVVPGHGKVMGVEAIKRQREYFEVIWEQARKGVAAGKPDYEIKPAIVEALKAYEKHYAGFMERIGPAISDIYLHAEKAAF
jgi:glyoxylase-like metal-dependent hydrolase (beta-lactamase superfamily II)